MGIREKGRTCIVFARFRGLAKIRAWEGEKKRGRVLGPSGIIQAQRKQFQKRKGEEDPVGG